LRLGACLLEERDDDGVSSGVSFSMRLIACSTSSSGETSPLRTSAAWLAASRNITSSMTSDSPYPGSLISNLPQPVAEWRPPQLSSRCMRAVSVKPKASHPAPGKPVGQPQRLWYLHGTSGVRENRNVAAAHPLRFHPSGASQYVIEYRYSVCSPLPIGSGDPGLPYRGKSTFATTVCATVSYARNKLPVRGTIALTVSHWFGNIGYEE
jgi:hypothetical protein